MRCKKGKRTEVERESRFIVGRLTTPHDLIVMLKTAGVAREREREREGGREREKGREGEMPDTTDYCAVWGKGEE